MSTEQRRLAGRYALDAPIGRGGMGEVWRATDTVLDREVAVKTIDLRRVPDEAGAARFEREAQVTAAMSHPNVVTVHDTGVEDDTAYLVMELLPGPSLADRMAEGPLPVDEVADVGRQVAAALEAAHERGLVHRDVKPANLVYAADGRVRVLDFGITQLGESAAANQALTATNTVMGTAEYLAPEQATGGRVDGRADLYALGCVLFALLTGRAPFSGPTPVATMMMHATDEAPDVRDLRPDTPAWLAGLVGSLLAKDPQDRPAGAGAVVAAIDARRAPEAAAGRTTVLPAAGAAAGAAATQRLDRGTPPPPPPPTGPARVGPPPGGREPQRRSSAGIWALAAVVAVLALVVGWQLLSGGSDEQGQEASSTPTSTTAEPAPTSEAPEPTTEAPEPTQEEPEPEPEPTEQAPDPAPVQDALGRTDTGLNDAAQADQADRQTVQDLRQQLRDVESALRDGDAEGVAEARDDFVESYREAVSDGEVSPEAAGTLDPVVQDLSNAVDAYVG
ncbi:serine/threonine protein kinase [Phycicoccus sp. BSK3Z-2]|uniref:non-specific serine/threonine protein kinase n=1 Tax=Phycicoccus avicenniae TaxID=2828860 RepID=A0A941HZK4_9MICO|nr:serine/threonine-protein kinase [Phycicoccus avicenniae]MBR7742264.1 serine/threonine protein kinase [Phycicoccus avicenniae]